MKKVLDVRINANRPLIVRLDGRAFSKFTRNLKKPFDDNFIIAMARTTADVMDEFHPVTCYSHSDEITLIFGPLSDPSKSTHIFGGRVLKIVTVLAGYVSARFNYHLVNIVNIHEKDYQPKKLEKIREQKAAFDARIVDFGEGKSYELLNHMIWRRQDSYRNAVAAYATTVLSPKQLKGIHSGDRITLMTQKGIDWESVPLRIKFGFYIKRLLPESNSIQCRSFYTKYSNTLLDILLSDSWTEGEQKSVSDLTFQLEYGKLVIENGTICESKEIWNPKQSHSNMSSSNMSSNMSSSNMSNSSSGSNGSQSSCNNSNSKDDNDDE